MDIPLVMSDTPADEFRCTQCMNCFDDRDTLFKHVRLMHQQHVQSRRKFKCEQCQRTFKSMSGLRNHSRTHSDFFAISAETLNMEADDTVSFYNTSATRTEEDSSLKIDSDSMQEKTKINCNDAELNDSVKHSADEIVFKPSKNIHNINSSHCKRRRSGIPVPINKSVIPNRKSRELDVKINLCSDEEQDRKVNEANNKAKSPTFKLTPEVENTYKTKINDRQLARTKFMINSPFGKKYAPKTANLLTPKSRSRSSSRTQRNRTRTPNSTSRTPDRVMRTPKIRMRTPNTGSKTPDSEIRTPKRRIGTLTRVRTPNSGQHTPRDGHQESVNVKGTPGSSKKNAYVSKAYNCKKCGKSFVDKSKLDVHFAIHIKETPEKCGILKNCLKKTPTNKMPRFQFADHLDNNATFSCKQCPRSYDKKCYLNAHMKTHDVEVPFSCAFCDKKFRFLSSLKAHSFVHSEVSNSHLDTLTLNYRNSNGTARLFTDESIQSSTGPNMFSIVPKYVNENDSLDLPFSCKMCDFKTRAPAELLSHMKSHSNSGSFKCTHCFKAYRLQKNLKMHEKVHTLNRLRHLLIDNANKTNGTT